MSRRKKVDDWSGDERAAELFQSSAPLLAGRREQDLGGQGVRWEHERKGGEDKG